MFKKLFQLINIFERMDPRTKRFIRILFLLTIVAFVAFTFIHSLKVYLRNEENKPRTQLAVLWTSADPDVARNVCFMYTRAAKRNQWFDDVRLIIWGPSAKLLSENAGLQQEIRAMKDDGVELQACVVCANRYGVADKLRQLGIEVKGMGKPLTDYLQSDWKVITF